MIDSSVLSWSIGTTAVLALITADKRIIVANAGDSRAVLCRGGQAIPLSHDHKPFIKVEHDRIVGAGGFVQAGRVNGNLALSRAIGDHEFKQNTSLPIERQMVTCVPDIISEKIKNDDEFMVIACDGIWDSLSSAEVVQFIKEKIDVGKMKLDKICEALIMKCVAPSYYHEPGGDNMTVVIVMFKR